MALALLKFPFKILIKNKKRLYIVHELPFLWGLGEVMVVNLTLNFIGVSDS